MTNSPISKLTHNGTTYDLKDSAAHETLDNLATVATSGDYNDLENKPNIPVVNDATVTITQNGETKGSFTVNADENVTISLDSGLSSISWGGINGTLGDQTDLQNALNLKADAEDIPANTSDLNNDSGFITESALSGYVLESSLSNVALSGDYSDLSNTPTIPTVNNAVLTIQKNGTAIDTFEANSSVNKTINIVVPTTAADVSALSSSTKYATGLSLTIDSSTYVITVQLKDQDGNNIGLPQTIDLPLESVVVSGSYDSENKNVVLTLQNGSNITISVANLVSGLQSEITSQNKLDADLVDDSTSVNKFVTASDKTTWNGKQDVISDLATIRAGANAGATAVQAGDLATVATSGSYTDLSGTPTLATVATSGSYADLSGTPNLATVATSGDYDDLSNKPTIPTVNNATLTITQGGLSKGTFTANSAVDATIALDGAAYDNSTINENASNQLQAIGVVDKNTSHDSGSLHYMPLWEGTQTQYDTGAQTTFYDWTYNGFGFNTVQLPDDFYGMCGCYGNGKYLVVDNENETVAYSSDVETWNTFPSGTLPYYIESIAYGAGKFVAIGPESGAYSVDDGENWTTIPDLYGDNIHYGEVNSTSAFFMFDGSLNTSSDGINWSEVEGFTYATLFPNSDEIVDICFGMGTIWMLTSTGKVAYSSDLTNWTVETIENSNNWSKIACSASNVCAIRQDGRTALRALDQWSITNTETISNGAFETLVWNSNSYVAISTNGIIRQSDATGNNWSVIGNISNDGDWYDGFYGNGKIVVGGFGIAYGGNIIQHVYTITNEPNSFDSTYSEPNGNSKNGYNKRVLEYDSEEDTIQLTDGMTVCNRNQAGDTSGTISVGEAHPEYLCFIDNNVVKRGDATIADRTVVDQVYNASSANAQSGVAVAQALATLDLTAYQTTANLTTSLSSASTDTQYPSAKCVYDIVGDIETLLSQV